MLIEWDTERERIRQIERGTGTEGYRERQRQKDSKRDKDREIARETKTER